MGLTGQVLIKAAQRAEATTGHQVSERQREEREPPDGSGRTYWQEIRFGSRSVYGQKRISFVPNSWKLEIFHSFLSDSLHSTTFKYNALIVTSTTSQLITLTGLRFTNAAEVKRHKLLPDSFPWTFALSGVKGVKHADISPHRVLRCPLWSTASVNDGVPTLKMAQSTKLCNWSCSRQPLCQHAMALLP